MDPISALVMTVAGGAVSAVGAARKGKADSQAQAYQAQVARNNQVISEQNAVREIDKGRLEEQAKRMQTRALIGSLRASGAGSGFDVNSGSKVDLMAGAADLGELDAMTIKNNAQSRADSLRNQGASFSAEASMRDRASKYASDSIGWNIASSILDTGSSVSDKWYKFKNVGAI